MGHPQQAGSDGSTSVTASLEDYPISGIVDGWKLKDGSLYLFVRCDDGVIRTVTKRLPRG